MTGSLLLGICILLGFGCPFALSQTACNSGHLRLVDGTGCKSYQECVHGRWLATFNCPDGLLFNFNTQTCDWSYNIDFQTCTTRSSPNPATSSSPASTIQVHVTNTSHGTDQFIQCGQKRCYHGTCWYTKDCVGCPHQNYRCECQSGYTGESCSQKVAPVSSGPVSTRQTTTSHRSQELGHWFKCGNIHCYHSSRCAYTCDGYDPYGRCLHATSYTCGCLQGYTGHACTLKKVSDVQCYSRGLRCHSGDCAEDLTTSNYVCHCSSGYTGDGCQLRIVDQRECHYYGLRCDHGDCVADAHYSTYHGKHWCNCYHGYTGHHCNHNAVTTVPTVNKNITTKSPTTPPSTSHSQTATSTTAATATTTTTASTPPPPTTAAETTTTSTPPTTPTAAATTTTSTPPTTTTAAATTTTPTPPTTATGSFSATSTMASTSSASTPDTPTSTRNNSPQTSTAPIQPHHCNRTTIISAIINVAKASNNDIQSCPSGSSATPEAFILAHCQLPISSMWTQGLKVQPNCNIIPLYTPVATFNHERYSSTGGLSGIFLGCIQDGFKLGVQQCDHPPTIVHVVNGGLFTMDPDVYFTVQ